MTAGCESWMSKLRKYVPKRFHFKRYYNVGMWLAILDHNENVTRHVRGERWRRGESLRHDGRWYTVTVRDPTTDVWRGALWCAMLAKARGKRATDGAIEEAHYAYVVDSTSVSKEAIDAWLSPPQTVSAAQPAGAARPAASAADGATQPVGVDADPTDADDARRG